MLETVEHPSEIITVSTDTTIHAAAVKMFTNKVGCLIVKNEDGKLAGIVTERDIVGHMVESSPDLDTTTVDKIMTTQVISCSPDTPTAQVCRIMTANQIRHLPVTDNDIVVGMVSTRDVMARQLLEDRAAAQEVAMLSSCLKSIDLNEVAGIVTNEVPKLFQAQRCVLYFKNDDSIISESSLLSYNNCCCPEDSLFDPRYKRSSDESGFHYDRIPAVCRECGAQSPRLLIPLVISSLDENSAGLDKSLFGYLCMCGLADFNASNVELTDHKAKLTREILNSHLTNAKLYQQARLISLTDALTGVGSRKLLEDRLPAECDRAKRYKSTFSIAIIDLDNFKHINDVLGHAAGDKALRGLADCMKSCKRDADILARYGGDEFVFLMPETKAEDAVTLLERLRICVREIKVAKDLPLTVSCGIAQSLPDHSHTGTASDVIRRADLALYEAKSAGKDCVKLWDETMSKLLNTADLETEKIKELQRRIAGLSVQSEKMFIQSIWSLVQALEAKDPFAKKHSENVMYYAVAIAQAMKIPARQVEIIRRATMIHDIGKIGVPDAILLKPEKLTPRERSIIEQHPLIAVRILEKMSFLEKEVVIVRHHHEKWKGQGYPDGLAQTSIPFGARILAVADTLDALTSDRSYHNSRSLEMAMGIIVDSSGYDFDPEAVKGMVAWIEKVRSEFDGAEHVTPDDLLNSQKRLDQNSMALFLAETVTSNSVS